MIFFDDLLRQGDFTRNVGRLSHPVRKAHGFPSLHQLGLVVPDVEQAAEKLEEQGFGPFFIARGAPVFWHENGRACCVTGKMGLAYYKGVETELLEPMEGSAFYRNSLDPDGRTVVQHLGFLVEDVDIWTKKLKSAGIGVWVRGQLKTGALKTDFVYMNPNEDDGLIMEFISWKLFGKTLRPAPGIAHTIGRFQKWSGRRCWSL
jgi:hypothetical protein